MAPTTPPQQYRLYMAGDRYLICTDDPSDEKQAQTLVINRRTNEVSLLAGGIPHGQGYQKAIVIYAVFGIASLVDADYLIVVTSRKRTARLFDSEIYQATDFALFPIDTTPSGPEKYLKDRTAEESYLLGLLKSHLFSAPFFFSSGGDYDLTTRLQAQSNRGGPATWEHADDRFFWNKFLMSRFIELSTRGVYDLSRFITPFVFGFCEFRTTTINSTQLVFGLISRRSRYRAGTRYFSRGIDPSGNVSNFNETEMICYIPKASGGSVYTSYVQIRGSVPVYWAEINNLRYKPDLKILDLANTVETAGKHFDQVTSIYGDVYAINLVNQKGYEKAVKDAFEHTVQQLANPHVHYTYFDFHHECKGLRFDKVSVLLNSLEEEIHNQGYYMVDSNIKTPLQTQNSVMRSNCMDCLDRTNVVQSALAQFVLTEQLRRLNILGPKESPIQHADFMNVFRNIWADNANAVSNAYSGSGALKTDYTRTGIRTKQGALMDGYNSALRYFKNNFLDGPRQDAYDLVTGAWISRKGRQSALFDGRPLVTRLAPYILFGTVFLLLLALWSPDFSAAVFGPSRHYHVLLVGTLIVMVYYILAHGIDYVSWPRLNSLQDVISYEGRGHESGRRGRGPSSYYGRKMDPTLHVNKESGIAGMSDPTRLSSVQGVGAPLRDGQRLTSTAQTKDWRRASVDQDAGKARID